jgi:hypothetical protein
MPDKPILIICFTRPKIASNGTNGNKKDDDDDLVMVQNASNGAIVIDD